jgi:glutamate N-acetyltransferase/amino-acid acetyltransferase
MNAMTKCIETANIRFIEGGVTAAQGFQAAGDHVGLKRKRKDLAILAADVACEVAATFTTNTAKAAPILWNKPIIEGGGTVKALVINSGNANSCTGAQGIEHAKQMAETTAACLGFQTEEILVSSTGIIGVPLPIEAVCNGIEIVSQQIGPTADCGTKAAEAIMTTDSFIKQAGVQFHIDGKLITIGAMAKGSGMVHPNMATMLSFLTTDLNITKQLLQKALSATVGTTYNMISVDGDTSTNDMVILFASGLAQNELIATEDENYQIFFQALNMLNEHLAKEIASDGEGASKLIEVKVTSAPSLDAAKTLARAVVSSNLVKAAFYANDPNWGRIIAAMGASGISFEMNTLSIDIESINAKTCLLNHGVPCWIEEGQSNEILSSDKIKVVIDLAAGTHFAKAWGCDLTHEYIKNNSKYKSTHLVLAKAGVVA